MSDTPESEAKPGPRKAKLWWQPLVTVVGITVVGASCYYAGLYISAEKRVRGVCARFTPGLSVAAVTAIAKAHGMNAPKNAATTYVVEAATSGRYGCKLEFKDGVLESSTYDLGN